MEVHMKVRIEIEVEVSELEFHGLKIHSDTEVTEAWGRRESHTTKYAEWDRVTWNDIECEVINDEVAADFLIDEAYYGEF
jgi:hypothetical protein